MFRSTLKPKVYLPGMENVFIYIYPAIYPNVTKSVHG